MSSRRPLAGFAAIFIVSAALAVGAILCVSSVARATTTCRTQLSVYGTTRTVPISRSRATSCPFARVIARRSLRFVIRAGGAGDGDFFIFAVSPVTHDAYKIHCWAHGDLPSWLQVSCRTGFGARASYRWGTA